jgi:hypothetical protein
MKHAKTALLWLGCALFSLAYGAFVADSLAEQIQTENAVYLTANK